MTPADAAAMQQLIRTLGGRVRELSPDEAANLFPAMGSMASRCFACTMIETAVSGLPAVVIGGLQEWVGSDTYRPYQGLAVALPDLPMDLFSPLVYSSLYGQYRGALLSAIRGCEGAPELLWQLLPSGHAARLSGAHDYRFTGCCNGILFAVRDASELDSEKALAALSELATLARFPWTPPDLAAAQAAQASRKTFEQAYLVAALVLGVAIPLLLVLGYVVFLLLK